MTKRVADECQLLFATQSLPLAAALMASGLTLSDSAKKSFSRLEFTFTDPRAQELSAKFIHGNLMVDAQTLFARYDDLRTLCRKAGVR